MELVGTSRSWEDISKALTHPVTLTGLFIVSILIALDIAAYHERKRRQKLVEIYSNQDDWYFTDIVPLFRKYKTREVIGLALLIIFLGSTTVYWVWKMPPKFGEHYTFEQMPRLGQLPEDGSDFNFKYPNRGRFACDFHITEEGFRKWISTHTRYTDCEEVVDMPLPEHKLLDQSIVINGLLAVPDGKTHNGACFDRETQRAYYWLWRTPQ